MSKGTYIEEVQTWKQRVGEVMEEMAELDKQLEIAETNRDLRRQQKDGKMCIKEWICEHKEMGRGYLNFPGTTTG